MRNDVGRIALLFVLLFLPGCGGKGKDLLVTSDRELHGRWFVRDAASQANTLELRFAPTGKYEEKTEERWRAGSWRRDESKLVITLTWMKMATGEELDLTDAFLQEEYEIRLRGDQLVMTLGGADRVLNRELAAPIFSGS